MVTSSFCLGGLHFQFCVFSVCKLFLPLMGWGKAELELGKWLQQWASFAPLMPQTWLWLPRGTHTFPRLALRTCSLKFSEFQNPVSNANLKSVWNHPINKLEQELSSHQGSWPATHWIEEPHLYVGPGWRKGTPDLSLVTRAEGWEMLVAVCELAG